MARIKSLSVPDTNKIPANGGTISVRGAGLVSTSKDDKFLTSFNTDLWFLSGTNYAYTSSPFLITLYPAAGSAEASLSSSYTVPYESSFNFEIAYEIVNGGGAAVFDFTSEYKLSDGTKYVSVKHIFNDISETSLLSIETEAGQVSEINYPLRSISVMFIYHNGIVKVFINNSSKPDAEIDAQFSSAISHSLGCYATGSSDVVSVAPKFFRNSPLISNIPSLNDSGHPIISSYINGEVVAEVYPGAPGVYQVVLNGNGDNLGNSASIGAIEVLSERFGEDSLKFLDSPVEKFYDDFTRLAVCPAKARADIGNPSKSVVVPNRCICDGSTSQEELTIGVRRAGSVLTQSRGEKSAKIKYTDEDGKIYGENFTFDRVILPNESLEQDSPINNMRMLPLSDGRILYYGVKSEPLAGNVRDVHIKLNLKKSNEIYEEQLDLWVDIYKKFYKLRNLHSNVDIIDVQSEDSSSEINIYQNLPVGKYSLIVYDADAEIRFDSVNGPLVDKEDNIELRYDYTFKEGSRNWPTDPVTADFQYLSEDKYVEFVFDVKRYNGQFIGYIYNPCNGSISKISSVYSDVNLSTESYSVVESDNGDLHFIYLPITNEDVMASRTSRLRVREVILADSAVSEDYVDIDMNRDVERIVSGRPFMSFLTGPMAVPSYITPTTIPVDIADLRKDFIHAFDVVKTSSSVKCYVSWGTAKRLEVRESHRLYKISNRRLKVKFAMSDFEGIGYYQPEIDSAGSAKCFYQQSPAVASQLEVYFLNPIKSNTFEELKSLAEIRRLSGHMTRTYDLVSYENVYNYSRNFIKNTQENLSKDTLIDTTPNAPLIYSIIDKSFRYMINSVGPSYMKCQYDPENDMVVVSMLDFLNKMPLVVKDSGRISDVCSPLHFSSIDFITKQEGEVFKSFSSCVGPDGFIYSVATSNSVRNSFEVGITDPSIMLNLSDTYVFENIANVRDNNNYVKRLNAAFYKNSFGDFTIPCMNSYRQNEGLTGSEIQRHNGYLMLTSGSSGLSPCMFVANGQDVYPFSIQSRQMYLPDIRKVTGGSFVLGSATSDGKAYIDENNGSFGLGVTMNLAPDGDPSLNNKLDDGYRFHLRMESINGELVDPYTGQFFVRRSASEGAGVKVKFYGSILEVYSVDGLNGSESLLGDLEGLPSGIFDAYLFIKSSGPTSGFCKIALVIKQPDHLSIYKSEGSNSYNFKNSYYKELLLETPILNGTLFQAMFLKYEDGSAAIKNEVVHIHQIDWGILKHEMGSYTYAAGSEGIDESFFVNSLRASRKFDDTQVFYEGVLPDHYFNLTQTYDNSGETYDRHWPYGFVFKYRATSVKSVDKWYLSKDSFAANSLDPYNVHTVWSSNDDQVEGHIWAISDDSGLRKFSVDTVILDGVNFPYAEIVAKNMLGDAWETLGGISLTRYVVDLGLSSSNGSAGFSEIIGGRPKVAIGESLYLYQVGGGTFKIDRIVDSTIYFKTSESVVPQSGLAYIFSSRASKIFEDFHKYRHVGIRIKPFNTYEGYFKVGALAFGKYSEIPLEFNHSIGSGVSYTQETELVYSYDNQAYFNFDKVIRKDYTLTYSVFDSLSYMKFRNILSGTGVSRKPIWIIDAYKVDNKEFSLCLIDGNMGSNVVRDDQDDVLYTVDMKFRSIK